MGRRQAQQFLGLLDLRRDKDREIATRPRQWLRKEDRPPSKKNLSGQQLGPMEESPVRPSYSIQERRKAL